MVKIAVVTDDGKTISMHFGRAAHYLVFTLEDGAITSTELRDKMGHRQFAQEQQIPTQATDDNHEHAHDHDHEHGHEHEQGHGFGAGAARKHALMVEAITDCEAVLVRGMGRGAYVAMQEATITPIVTDIPDAEAAVKAYIAGDIVDHTDKLH
jgi:predicted Fe-Mo cluster-binding NifX family protein